MRIFRETSVYSLQSSYHDPVEDAKNEGRDKPPSANMAIHVQRVVIDARRV